MTVIKSSKVILTLFLSLCAVCFGAVETVYLFKAVPAGAEWLFPWMNQVLISLIVLCIGTVILTWMPGTWRLRLAEGGALFVMLALLAAGRVLTERSKVIINFSPDRKNMLVLEKNTSDGTVTSNRVYFYLLRRPAAQFPYTVKGGMKIQWLENDVCAVTYRAADGTTHQYLATYGDRGDGISYLDPLTAIGGNWTAEGEDEEGWEISIAGGDVEIRNGSESWSYTSDDCVRFGTTAMALCRNGYPEWSLVLNEDCRINYNDLVAKGGTLTLCPVSMEKTSPSVYICTDEKDEYSETNPHIEEDEYDSELAEARGTFFVETQGDDELWNVRTALLTHMEKFRVNGVDVRVQIDTIRRTEGDAKEGVYEITVTELCISPGNQGSRPTGEAVEMNYRMHMTRTDGGYNVYVLGIHDPGTYGLSGEESELFDLSDNEDYHFFLAGEYDTTYMYVDWISPEEALEEVYAAHLQSKYPAAQKKEFDGMAYMDLSGDGKVLLLYDGITEDHEKYAFQIAQNESGELSLSSHLTRGETYETEIRFIE